MLSAVATLAAAVSAVTAVGPAHALTTDELAGQRIVYAYAGLNPPATLISRIKAGEAGGVIFFGNNISSRAQIKAVINRLQRASLSSPLHDRLLMMTDQEGGQVRRLSGAPTSSEKQIGASPDPLRQARASGSGAARNLAGVGVNLNLAPVLDVYRQAGNFIDQYGRSYSRNSRTVASLGAAFVSSQQRRHVAATAKHFPGLGAAARSQDTDVRPVTLHLSLATLRNVDEAPYTSAIGAGVKVVMTSWAVYPALDAAHPAGLSSRVIGGELRGRLHFKGVTITDGIDAGAVTPYGNLGQRGVRAAGAGADLILCATTNPANNTPQQGITVLNAIASALRKGKLSRPAAQASANRILSLRARP
jgi:beta-N-acetylhexosaminidase